MIDTGAIVVTVSTHEPGAMPTIRIENERPSGLIHNLLKKGVPDIRRTVSVLYGLCPIAHLSAMDIADRAAKGLSEEERRAKDHSLFERAVALEALLENMRVFLTDVPSILSVEPQNEALRALGRLRAQMMVVASLLVASPETAETIEKTHRVITQATKDAVALLESNFFAMPVAKFYAMEKESDFEAWRKSTPGIVTHLLRRMTALPLGFGQVHTHWLPRLTKDEAPKMAEELYQRLRCEPHFDMMPVLEEAPRLTGAIVRQEAHPLLKEVIEHRDVVPFTLTLARLLDTADLALGLLVSDPESGEADSPDVTRLPALVGVSFPHEGGMALVETARGLLIHAKGWQPVTADEAPERFYAVTSPTEWQFAPSGPAQEAVHKAFRALLDENLIIKTPEGMSRSIRLALFGLDPCVPIQLIIDGKPQPLR